MVFVERYLVVVSPTLVLVLYTGQRLVKHEKCFDQMGESTGRACRLRFSGIVWEGSGESRRDKEGKKAVVEEHIEVVANAKDAFGRLN